MDQHHDSSQGIPAGCPAHGNIPLYGAQFGADPEATYGYLRYLGLSAAVDIAPGVPVELVTSYDAALYILQNTEIFRRDSRRWNAMNQGLVPADSPAIPMMGYRPNALFSDGAAHARLRQAVVDSLATVNELQLRRKVQQSAQYLISQFGTETRGNADVMVSYAMQLPLLVFSDLFGCPPELGDRVIAGISGIFQGTPGANEILGAALAELIALKHRQPGTDLTTKLMQHKAQLTDEEVLHQLVTLLSGGTAPTAAAIGTSTALYLGDEGQAALPVEDAVYQTLWNYAPIANYAGHYPIHDIELGDRILRAGDPVLISFAAANTDPKLTQHREQRSPKAHLSFGAGPHACPAKDPAFMITVTAVEALLTELPDLAMRVPFKDLQWAEGPWSRTLVGLPVQFTPRALAATSPAPTAGPQQSAPAPHHAAAAAPQAAARATPQQRGLYSRFRAWLNGE
ncbi:cytochrome P450 [Streptomyces sp. NPDC048419]|uniref:cytochrome P450 n=1 Tax=Streptomyces sp. NPDC048419 TaxID=3365547 RepID=UPI003714BF7E